MSESRVVYLDIMFSINLIMDLMILWAVAKFGQFRTTFLRLLAGALTGALYSLSLLFPELDVLLTIWVKLIFSVLIVLIAFPWKSFRIFMQTIGYFYLISFAAAGAMLGGVYLFKNSTSAAGTYNGVYTLVNVPYMWLLAGVAALILVGRFGSQAIKKNLLKSIYQVSAIICFQGRQIPTKALVDTGNQLKDPLTQRPVMIVEYSLLKSVLPVGLQKIFKPQDEVDLEQALKILSETPWAVRVRIIPFNTIGKQKGLLLGLKPDAVYIVTEDKTVKHFDVIIGIYHRSLSPEGNYRALLHPELLQATFSS